ncbi:MAG: hypothetical protein O3A62_03650, partial [Actinomycetota bacterium]|nr:hypothetical protein [Actinomycetota bacterium]
AQALAKSTTIEVVAVADPSNQSIEFAKNTFRNADRPPEIRRNMRGVSVSLVARSLLNSPCAG